MQLGSFYLHPLCNEWEEQPHPTSPLLRGGVVRSTFRHLFHQNTKDLYKRQIPTFPHVPETNQGEGVGGLDGDKLQIIQAMWHLPLQHIEQQNGAGFPVRLLIDGIEAGEGARLDLYLVAAFGELAQLLA